MDESVIQEFQKAFDAQNLLKLAKDSSEESRAKLTAGVSRIFDQELSEPEQKLASEILLNLLKQAEKDLKGALSERLSVMDNVPLDLMLALAHEEIEVAEPVLTNSTLLSDVDLVYIVKSKTEEYWKAIAKRENLSTTVTDSLVQTGDRETVLILVNNESATLTKFSMHALTRMAITWEDLHQPLLSRKEVDADIAMDLYLCVANELRKQILEKFTIDKNELDEALNGVLGELMDGAQGRKEVTPELESLAVRFRERDEITTDLLIRVLRRGQMAFFIALFAELVELPTDAVLHMIENEGGKTLAVAARSAGIVKSEFASVFLLSRGIRSGDKVVDRSELATALGCFDKLKMEDAKKIMEAWRKDPDMIQHAEIHH